MIKKIRPLPNFEAFQSTDTITSQDYTAHLASKYWHMIRTHLLNQHKYQYQLCHVPYKAGLLHVHHMSYRHVGCEHEHLRELILVCQACHSLIHRWSEPTYKTIDPYRNQDQVPSPEWIQKHLSVRKKLKKTKQSKNKFTAIHSQNLDSCISNLFAG